MVTWMDASKKKPNDKMKLAKWDKNEALIMSFVEPHIVLNLCPYKTITDI